MDHLLIFCPLAHSMWMHMIQLFGIDWVMPGSVADLLCCWHHWLGKNNSFIWNMWTIWTECNQRSFENIEKSMAQLLDLCQRTQCWGLSNCSTIIDFLLFLRIGFWFLYNFLLLAVLCSLLWTLCIFCSFLLIILLSYLSKIIIIIITIGFDGSFLSLPSFFSITVDRCGLWVLLKVFEKLRVLPCQTSFKFYNKPTYLLKHPI